MPSEATREAHRHIAPLVGFDMLYTDALEDASLAEVLGGIVDNDAEIIELEAEIVARLVPADIDLVMQDYRCRIVSVVAATLERWQAAKVG